MVFANKTNLEGNRGTVMLGLSDKQLVTGIVVLSVCTVYHLVVAKSVIPMGYSCALGVIKDSWLHQRSLVVSSILAP